MIFKLQRPLSTNDPSPRILAYDENRAIMRMLPMEERYLKYFKDGKVKAYVHARMNGYGDLEIEGPAPWQEW